MQLELSLVLKQWKEVISRSAVGLLTAQVAREAYFNGQSYLDLKLDNLPGITDNFYAGVGFRTEKSNALLLYHQAEVLILTDQLAKPSVMILLKRYVSKVYAVCVFSTEWGVSSTVERRLCGGDGWQKWGPNSEDLQRWEQSLRGFL